MARSGTEDLVGRLIAQKFLIEAPIGAGAMGAVFRARQVALDKAVAIKVLHGEHAGDATFAARFHREAKAASRLNHPNSMQVIDFGAEPDGLLYIAMELLDGRSLHRVIREDRPMPARRVADLLMQALAAIAVAHDMGVVHRDLKPENIMILSGTDDDGRPRDIVKVCDFGIAKITDSRAYRDSGDRPSQAPVTTAGFMVGTPEYMSPEQGSGEKLDARSDLYSMGVILFEMLTGRVPFETENAIGTVLKHINEAPRRPSELDPQVDARLEAICLRAMLKRREERYQSAREMRAELRAVSEGPASAGAPLAPGPAVRLMTDSPASVNAATLRAAVPIAAGSSSAADSVPKPTLEGAAASIPGVPRSGRVFAVAAGAATLGLVGTLSLFALRHRPPTVAENRPAASDPAGAMTPVPFTEIAPLSPVDPHSPQPTDPARPAPPQPAKTPTTPQGVLPGPKPPTATATPTPTATPAPTPTPTATPTPTPTPTSPPTPPPDPTFDPANGYVEVGIINTFGVRDRAVRGAVHGVALGTCYKNALRTRGAGVTGVAMLNLSFDEAGAVRSALLTGGDFLPGLTRCIQGASSGLHVPAAAVESGGATAEVTLAFKVR